MIRHQPATPAPATIERMVFQCGDWPSPRLVCPTVDLPPSRRPGAAQPPSIPPTPEPLLPPTPEPLLPSADRFLDMLTPADAAEPTGVDRAACTHSPRSAPEFDLFGLGDLVVSARAVVADCERTRRRSICLQQQADQCVNQLAAFKTRTALPPNIPSPATGSPIALPVVSTPKSKRRRSDAEIAKLAALKQQRLGQQPATMLIRACSFRSSHFMSKMSGALRCKTLNRVKNKDDGAIAWTTWICVAARLKQLIALWRERLFPSLWNPSPHGGAPDLDSVTPNNAAHATRLRVQRQVNDARELESRLGRAQYLANDVDCTCLHPQLKET